MVDDIHEQNLRTDLQQSFDEGRSTTLKAEAYECGQAVGTAEASSFWEAADGFIRDGEDGWWEERTRIWARSRHRQRGFLQQNYRHITYLYHIVVNDVDLLSIIWCVDTYYILLM